MRYIYPFNGRTSLKAMTILIRGVVMAFLFMLRNTCAFVERTDIFLIFADISSLLVNLRLVQRY